MDKKQKTKKYIDIIGSYILKYNFIYVILLSIISAVAIIMMIRGILTYDFRESSDYARFMLDLALLVVSLTVIGIFFGYQKAKAAEKIYTITAHIYCFFLIVISLFISIIDMSTDGDFPVVYLTAITVIGGVVLLYPVAYAITTVISYMILILFDSIRGFTFFNSVTPFINTLIFVIISLLLSFRLYRVMISEMMAKKELEEKNVTDVLTGLGNESAYFKAIDVLDKDIKNGVAKFALAIMDVNGVKATNDQYGHHFGCHLIVETGKILPSIFKTSQLFHIGGDEFVAIIQGEDYDLLRECISRYEEKLTYQEIEFEDQNFILSVARGFAIYDSGMDYNDVFQRADDEMYTNKHIIKKKYNIAER